MAVARLDGLSPARRTSWTVAALSLGTALNSLSTTTIAVALLDLQRDLGLRATELAAVVTVFYVASMVGQPLMGRLVDLVGARRIFSLGMVVVLAAAAIAPLGHSFGSVLAARVVLAIGTSVAFPAAVSMVEPLCAASGASAAQLLGRLQLANTMAATLGPAVGGILVSWGGWPAVFWVNVPMAALALIGIAMLAPPVPGGATRAGSLIATVDVVGVTSFAAAVVMIVTAALGGPWWLALPGGMAAVFFLWWERRIEDPFIDIRTVAGQPALRGAYLAFAAFNVVSYLLLFGLPQFFGTVGGYSERTVGLLMLPMSAANVVLTVPVARGIDRFGTRAVLKLGAALVGVAVAAQLLGLITTELFWLAVMSTAAGLPFTVITLSVMHIMQSSSAPGTTGVAVGVLQVVRFVGAIVATIALGYVFDAGATVNSWTVLVVVAGVVAALHAMVVLALARPEPQSGQSGLSLSPQ